MKKRSKNSQFAARRIRSKRRNKPGKPATKGSPAMTYNPKTKLWEELKGRDKYRPFFPRRSSELQGGSLVTNHPYYEGGKGKTPKSERILNSLGYSTKWRGPNGPS
jgi:hypothetical protein